MYEYIIKIRNFTGLNYDAKLMYSIYLFVRNRDIDKAINELKKCKAVRDVTWKYNLAFLYAYKSDLKRAKLIYKSAFKGFSHPNITLQTEVFIEWILEEEPDKIQFYYCLGLINWFDKGDLELAILNFNKFIETDTCNKFPTETEISKSYLNTIRGELKRLENDGSNDAV
jgi:tetratricopeptide (TPR) repeat protein